MQVGRSGAVDAAKRREWFQEIDGAPGERSFRVYAKRIPDAVEAMLIFVNPDRTWVMYKDATGGEPKDQLYTVKLDEATLAEAEDKRSAARHADHAKAAADSEANKAAELEAERAEAARLAAIEDAKYRKWSSANGKNSVEAKFVSVGQGKVTLQRRDGTKLTVSLKLLSEADQKFVNDEHRATTKAHRRTREKSRPKREKASKEDEADEDATDEVDLDRDPWSPCRPPFPRAQLRFPDIAPQTATSHDLSIVRLNILCIGLLAISANMEEVSDCPRLFVA